MRNAPVVDREGMPSWSYSHVEEERDDRVHTLVPTTGMDLTGALCANAVKYSSMYTGAATPDAIVDPPPTRTTARLNASNGVTVEVGVEVGTEVTDAVVEPDGVAEEVAVVVAVGAADSEGAAVPDAELVTVDSGVPVMDGLAPNEIEADPV